MLLWEQGWHWHGGRPSRSDTSSAGRQAAGVTDSPGQGTSRACALQYVSKEQQCLWRPAQMALGRDT